MYGLLQEPLCVYEFIEYIEILREGTIHCNTRRKMSTPLNLVCFLEPVSECRLITVTF